jgi:type II secretory pathway pseudopilin PulG
MRLAPLPAFASAFTMMEATVAFTLLGIVAALTLPSLLDVTSTEQDTTRYKRNMALVHTLAQNYYASDRSQTFQAFALANLKSSKTCTTNGNTEGCSASGANLYNNPTALMPDGSALLITSWDVVYIDANGPSQGGNSESTEMLSMLVNAKTVDIRQKDSASTSNGSVLHPGEAGLLYDINSTGTFPAGVRATYTAILGDELVGTTGSGEMNDAITVSAGNGGTAANTDGFGMRNGSFTPAS